MNNSIQSTTTRSAIDLDLYTDGDPELRRELISLMIDNIKELQQSLITSYQTNDIELFRKTCHKVKPTISMVNDKELTDSIEEMKVIVNEENREQKLSSFNRLCLEIIKLLDQDNS